MVRSDVMGTSFATIIPQFSCFTIAESVSKRGSTNQMGWGPGPGVTGGHAEVEGS